MNSLFKKNIFIVLLSITLLVLSGCQTGNDEIKDMIAPITLTTEAPDTLLVSDLFFAERYDIEFLQNDLVDWEYDPQTLRLILKAVKNREALTLLDFTKSGRVYSAPIHLHKKKKYHFSYKPAKDVEKITIFGSFNSWNRKNLPMRDDDGDGTYDVELYLEPGKYEYRFWLDGKEIIDPGNPAKIANPWGEYNSLLIVPDAKEDQAFLHLSGFTRKDDMAVMEFYYEHDPSKKLIPENVIVLADNRKISAKNIKVKEDTVKIFLRETKEDDFTVRVAVSKDNSVTPIQTVRIIDGVPADCVSGAEEWTTAVMYSIMIDRFNNGDPSNDDPIVQEGLNAKANYQGGDLQGIINKLNEGYFDSLGINVLWLSPVVENTDSAYKEWPEPHRWFSAYHGYWPVNSYKVEKHFGNMALLKKLVKIAHEKGIRVILDFVSNHTHIDHPYFKQHRDWYGQLDLPDGRKNIRFWDEYRLTTWFEPFLPSFDYQKSHEAVEAMTDNAIWWLDQAKIDGFRHDAVKHVPNLFWRTLTSKIKRRFPNKKIYQIGETFGSYRLISSYVNNGQLDAQFNFNLYDAALYVFIDQQSDFKILATEMEKTFLTYGMNHLMGNLMDSHDKVRFMAYADGDVFLSGGNPVEIGWNDPPTVENSESYDKTALYLAYMLTIPGIPTIYYGDEIGMSGAADPDNRRMMRFGEQLNEAERAMFKRTSSLIKLRRNSSALNFGDFQTLYCDKDVWAYLRNDLHETVLVILNKGAVTRRAVIPLPAIYRVRSAVNMLTGGHIEVAENRLNMSVPPYSYRILKLSKN